MSEDTAGAIIQALGLAAHPEDGWYAETWRAPASGEAGTAGPSRRSAWATTFEPASNPRPSSRAPAWQAARSLGAWSLAGCTVAPAFEFAGFELAPAGWQPGPTGYDGPGDGEALGSSVSVRQAPRREAVTVTTRA